MSRGDFDNTNRGALFVNDKKEIDTHPDWTGQIDVDGKEFWLSGWKKKSKKGDPYISVAIKPKEQKRAASGGRSSPPPRDDDRGDDIPW